MRTITLKLSVENAEDLLECIKGTSARGNALQYGLELEEILEKFVNAKQVRQDDKIDVSQFNSIDDMKNVLRQNNR